MAQPPAYYPTYIFRDEEFTANLLPLWDVEFGNISVTLEHLLHNLAIIQRDDTKLANGSVHPLALSAETLHLLQQSPNWKYAGRWEPYKLYDVGDIVKHDNQMWLTAICHTSGICDDGEICPECDIPLVARIAVTGVDDAYSTNDVDPIEALEDTRLYRIVFQDSNVTEGLTVDYDGTGVKAVVDDLGAAIVASGIVALDRYDLRYDLANDRFILSEATVSISDEWDLCFYAEVERDRLLPLCCGASGSGIGCLEDTSGSGTQYTILSTSQDTITEYFDGMMCVIRWHAESGEAATLNIDTVGERLISFDNTNTIPGDLEIAQLDLVAYNAVKDTFDIIGRDRVVIPEVETPWYTGDTRNTFRKEPAVGWTFLDGHTIGNIGSGADEEGLDLEDLFNFLKNVHPNNGSEDWISLQRVFVPDHRNVAMVGWQLMQNPLQTPDPELPEELLGGNVGERFVTLTENEMPSHTHGMNSDGDHYHTVATSSMNNTSGVQRMGDIHNDNEDLLWTSLAGYHKHSVWSSGGGQPHDNVSPALVMSVEIHK